MQGKGRIYTALRNVAVTGGKLRLSSMSEEWDGRAVHRVLLARLQGGPLW